METFSNSDELLACCPHIAEMVRWPIFLGCMVPSSAEEFGGLERERDAQHCCSQFEDPESALGVVLRDGRVVSGWMPADVLSGIVSPGLGTSESLKIVL